MDGWEIVFYESPAGRSPVQEYLDDLSAAEVARIIMEMELLQEFGPGLGMPHVRRIVGTDIWELRIRGGTQHRVFYVSITGRQFLLLHAFQKKTQKMPDREIKTALTRLIDHRRRNMR